jgi:hypothetical protein
MNLQRNTLARSLHDVGAATWFGGALMGAVGLNGAAAQAQDPAERTDLAVTGWARWAPVAAAAIGAHLIGGAGLLARNRGRVRVQKGVRANTVAKVALTGAAMATTAYSGYLGRQIAQAREVPTEGATEAAPGAASNGLGTALQRQRVLQWATPVLTGAVIVLGAQQGEQQRGDQVLRGVGSRLRSSSRSKVRATGSRLRAATPGS